MSDESRERIIAALGDIETRHACRILFAVESGSRAWGFASPDSDYDVRGVYLKPIEWYLQLKTDLPDTITETLPGAIDVSLWDLRKALVHMLKSNASFLEWLDSPITYCGQGFRAQLRAMAATVANPRSIAFHYAAMLRHALDDQAGDGTLSVKKLCYALRAGLCVRWAMARGTMPPTAFADVRRGVELTPAANAAIDRLLAIKSAANEKDRLVPDVALAPLIEDQLGVLGAHVWREPSNDLTAARAAFTRFFREQLLPKGT